MLDGGVSFKPGLWLAFQLSVEVVVELVFSAQDLIVVSVSVHLRDVLDGRLRRVLELMVIPCLHQT